MATKKAGKKAAAKKAAAKKAAGKKAAAKKAASKKRAAKKGGAKKAPSLALASAGEPCLDLVMASEIIRACAPAGFDINRPLCQFLAPANLPFLQQCILNQVLARGCNIQRSQIPADCNSTLGDILQAIVNNATK